MTAKTQRGKDVKKNHALSCLFASLHLGGLYFLLMVSHEVRAADDILKTLRPNHPRVYVTDDDLARVRESIDHDPLAKQWRDTLRAFAAKMLDEPVVEHALVGPRMLGQSRAALRRISTLAGMYRIDGRTDKRLADRARAEMLALARFDDWNASQSYLDVAKCTNAMAIGYDWLFDELSPQDRATIREAIVTKGLNEGIKAYVTRHWWTTADHNYAIVCCGGLTAGALAIADESPELARSILALTRTTITLPMSRYAPDGGWHESPAYWNYATRYNVFYLEALRSALGTDFGLSDSAGFSETGFFGIQSIGPTGKVFNYGDGGDAPAPAPQMLWMARRFNHPIYAAHERALSKDRPDIFHLLWFDADGKWPPNTSNLLPTATAFRGVGCAFLRTAWNDPQATFLGFKGGDNRANHSHLDLGSFVLEAKGERWAIDLGADDYDLPGYFNIHRWEYYRTRTEGHNTLVLDGCNQDPEAVAPIVGFAARPQGGFAVVDLSDAYKVAARVWRGIDVSREHVLIQDEIELYRPVSIVWNLHTRADVSIVREDPRRLTLRSPKASIPLELIEPAEARFEVISADAPPPQRQQPDVRNVVVRLAEGPKSVRIVVRCRTSGERAEDRPAITPMSQWIANSKK